MNAWMMLAAAILFEIVGTSLLKASDGFANWLLGTASITCYIVSLTFMAVAIKVIPVGIAYAIWSGAGIVAITIVGWFAFKQSLSIPQLSFMALIVIGCIGLNLSSSAEV